MSSGGYRQAWWERGGIIEDGLGHGGAAGLPGRRPGGLCPHVTPIKPQTIERRGDVVLIGTGGAAQFRRWLPQSGARWNGARGVFFGRAPEKVASVYENRAQGAGARGPLDCGSGWGRLVWAQVDDACAQSDPPDGGVMDTGYKFFFTAPDWGMEWRLGMGPPSIHLFSGTREQDRA